MKPTHLFYEESNKIAFPGLLLAMSISTILAMGLGYLYTIIQVALPLVYFSALVTIAVAFGLSLVIRLIAKWTHNRNKRSQWILLLFTVILLNYFQWIAYVLYAYIGQIPSFMEYLQNLGMLLLAPRDFFSAIAQINEFGLWSIGGVDVRGSLLGTVWAVEFGLLFLLPLLQIMRAPVFPYSETQGKWYPKYTLEEQFQSIPRVEKLLQDLQHNAVETIAALDLGRARRYTKVHVYYLPEEQAQYLSFELLTIDQNSNTDKEAILEHWRIDTAVAKQILARFPNKREHLEVF